MHSEVNYPEHPGEKRVNYLVHLGWQHLLSTSNYLVDSRTDKITEATSNYLVAVEHSLSTSNYSVEVTRTLRQLN